MKSVQGYVGLKLAAAFFLLVLIASPPAQAQYLNQFKAQSADGYPAQRFGASVAIDGDLAVVGATNDDENGVASGAAYVFQRNAEGDKWIQVAKLIASDGSVEDYFGCSVAIDGDFVVVGAWGDDDLGDRSGSAYVFARDHGGPDNWGQVKKLLSGDLAALDNFGISVSVSGDIALVGSPGHDDAAPDAGAVYFFDRNHNGVDNWGQVRHVSASDGADYVYYGISVSIDGNDAIVGAGNDDELGNRAGAAYILNRNTGGADNWGEVKKVTAVDGEQYVEFGNAVDIDGDHAIVGCHRDNDHGSNTGSAYILSRDYGGVDNWGQRVKMVPVDAVGNDYFGHSVGIDGDMAIVGAWEHSTPPGNAAGAIYAYARHEGGADTWGQTDKLTPYVQGDWDKFGGSVGVSGDTLVGGAHQHDGSTGAAWFFNQPAGAHINVTPNPVSLSGLVGQTSDPVTITVYSVGTTDLTVSSIADPGGEFSLDNLPALPSVLSPGATLTFDVLYAPGDAGSDTATADVSSDDANDATIAVSLEGTAVNPAQPGVAYGSTGSNDDGRVLTIDPATGASAMLVDIEDTSRLTGVAIDSAGRVVVCDYDDYALHWIDGVTGDVYRQVDTSEQFTSIAFDENDVLYACYYADLYILDPETGDEDSIGSMDDDMAGLAFDPTDGTLYASVYGGGSEPDAIYTVDKTNGDTTLVGYTGLGDGIPDIAFDADGNLYGVKGGGSSSDNQLIAIDKATGAGTVIGYTGFTAISGLDIGRPTSMPTVSADLTCLPASGTVPFSTTFSMSISNNYTGLTRRMAAVVNLALANGGNFNNWRAGYTNVAAGDTYAASWVNIIPAVGSVIGINTFTLVVEDVTPAPYNLPPYPPAGDADSDACTVEGIAP